MTNNAGNIISNSQVVFIDDFRSEYDTRVRKGGVPTDVTYNADGTITLNGTSSKINYNLGLNGTYTVKIICNPTSFAAAMFMFDCRGIGGNGYILLDASTGNVNKSGGIAYVDGIPSITTQTGRLNEIVVSGITLKEGTGTNNTLIGSGFNNANKWLGSIDSVTIYEGTLSASQVKNLYTKSEYVALTPMSEQLGGELNILANAINPITKTNATTGLSSAVLDVFTSQSVVVNTGDYAILGNANGSPTNNARFYKDVTDGDWGMVYGQTYSITIIARHVGSGGQWTCGFAANTSPSSVSTYKLFDIVNTTTAFTIYTLTFTHNINSRYFTCGETSATNDGGVYVDILSIKEVLHPSISILSNLRMTDGEVKDDYNTITNTDVSIVQAGGKTAGLFNGLAFPNGSNLDYGSNLILGVNTMFATWINIKSFGASAVPVIIGNSNNVGIDASYRLYSYFGAFAYSANNSIKFNKDQFIAFTLIGGIINFYIGDKDNSPTLSGTANQNTGTLAGTTNLIIGNTSAGSRPLHGSVSDIHIESFGSYDETALKARLTQYWSLTRKNK